MLGLVFDRMRCEVSLYSEKRKIVFMCAWAFRKVIVILQKLRILNTSLESHVFKA
jgi:hypothetical protein